VRLLALQPRKVLAGYDAVCSLYPYVPPLSHWRAWEYAAYQRYRLTGRILDLGCGDGRYFRLLWPRATDVIGVDIDPTVAELGSRAMFIAKCMYLQPTKSQKATEPLTMSLLTVH
jgi:SAM-dependent methyltransferase